MASLNCCGFTTKYPCGLCLLMMLLILQLPDVWGECRCSLYLQRTVDSIHVLVFYLWRLHCSNIPYSRWSGIPTDSWSKVKFRKSVFCCQADGGRRFEVVNLVSRDRQFPFAWLCLCIWSYSGNTGADTYTEYQTSPRTSSRVCILSSN